ncbi:hypothetical protein [Rhodovulum sulfidophilum]|uniref:hypothetical protein n=1 Tax=Rhodovulum sulfidophilum TaxID=35806 RepID=UPI0015BD912F|nr:hypothetical protein [Rhodovulum sulfidophilum]MBL3552990.1 hypothetical protein [Rhodovulum sulfidophilum]
MLSSPRDDSLAEGVEIVGLLGAHIAHDLGRHGQQVAQLDPALGVEQLGLRLGILQPSVDLRNSASSSFPQIAWKEG